MIRRSSWRRYNEPRREVRPFGSSLPGGLPSCGAAEGGPFDFQFTFRQRPSQKGTLMATLILKRYECPNCGFVILKTKAAGDEGFCLMPHDQPFPMAYKGEVEVTTV